MVEDGPLGGPSAPRWLRPNQAYMAILLTPPPPKGWGRLWDSRLQCHYSLRGWCRQ